MKQSFYSVYDENDAIQIIFNTSSELNRYVDGLFYHHYIDCYSTSKICYNEIKNTIINEECDDLIYNILEDNEIKDINRTNHKNCVFQIYNRKLKRYINPKSKDLNDTFKIGKIWSDFNQLYDFINNNKHQLTYFIDVYEHSYISHFSQQLTKILNNICKFNQEFKKHRIKRLQNYNINMKKQNYYRIKDNSNNYSCGLNLHYPIFNNNASRLFSLHDLKEHLLITKKIYPDAYKNCIIEECELNVINEHDANIKTEKFQLEILLGHCDE